MGASIVFRAERVVILVAIALIAAISIFGFASGLFGSFSNGLSATVDPQIYAPQQNIGVLNQNATFIVTVSNSLTSSVAGVIALSAGAQTVITQQFALAPGQSETYHLSTNLYTIGEWTMTVSTADTVLHPYSFVVEQNTDAADSLLTANSTAQQQTFWLIAGPLLAALIGLAPGTYGLYLRRKDRRPAVLVQRFKKGTYWFVRVTSTKGYVQKCLVFHGERQLALKDPANEQVFETTLGPGGSASYRFEGLTPIPDGDFTQITVKNDKSRLFRRPFSDLPIGEGISGPVSPETTRVEEEGRRAHLLKIKKEVFQPIIAAVDQLIVDDFRTSEITGVVINNKDDPMPKWNLTLFMTPVQILVGAASDSVMFNDLLYQDLGNHFPDLKTQVQNAERTVESKGSHAMQLRWQLAMKIFELTKPEVDVIKADGSYHPMGVTVSAGLMVFTGTPEGIWPNIHAIAEKQGILKILERLKGDPEVMRLAREWNNERREVEDELLHLREALRKEVESERRLQGVCLLLPLPS